jgi:hypothetical protein
VVYEKTRLNVSYFTALTTGEVVHVVYEKNTCYVSYFTALTTVEVVYVVNVNTRIMFHTLLL